LLAIRFGKNTHLEDLEIPMKKFVAAAVVALAIAGSAYFVAAQAGSKTVEASACNGGSGCE
jgi:hypothetical protein